MKRLLSVLAVVLSLGLVALSFDAEAAKRLGSGKSMGTQRQSTVDKAPATPATQATAPAAAGAAAGAAAAPSRSWMGPVAGLAAGLGIAALASHLGFGEELASMVMLGLVVLAIMLVIGLVLRRRAVQSPGGLVPAAAGAASVPQQQVTAYKTTLPESAGGSTSGSMIGSALGSPQTIAAAIPADFDRVAFERNAKVNFIRLQAAYDAGNAEDIRSFTTPELFAELKLDLAARDPLQGAGDVARLDAEVIEVVEDADQYLVSVKFSGFIRYGVGIDDETFNEIWHLTRPRNGQSGWVLAGIQQVEEVPHRG